MNSSITKPVVNAVNSVKSGAMQAVNGIASGAANAVNSITSGAANAASAIGTAATNAVNTAMNSSLIPLGNTGSNAAKNGTKNGNTSVFTNLFTNTNGNAKKNATAEPSNTAANVVPSLAAANFSVNATSGGITPLKIFMGLVIAFLVIFAIFSEQIKQGYAYFSVSVKRALGLDVTPDVVSGIVPTSGQTVDLTVPPMPPQYNTPAQQEAVHQSLVEKVLPPPNTNEVFNVAQNKFTYYDAEPLCRALGAELATYEQVKEAWNKGADWCNYGWVKGQMAVYPTQKDTYERLQAGPVDERGACGTTGINGGFFDNPELRYGVNCYGKKPDQTAHDEVKLMEEGKIPRSPATLKIDQMVNTFKAEADSLFVKPFSDEKWSSA